ncbi:hypothetical protein ABIB62_003780 [Mucilaginibacter sp. UYP25]|uniref:HNH endonuclease n=1 Tax=unclassified Mucilaginibacter TaxID=2617802 RepID=UPI00339A8811
MEYIISKGAELPDTELKMETMHWFNMWATRKPPYSNLLKGDVLYWLDKVKARIVWKTVVTEVNRYPYDDKLEVYKLYGDFMTQSYFDSRPQSGYFLNYQVKVLARMDIRKPDLKFDQLGWEMLDKNNYNTWFSKAQGDDTSVLDDNITLGGSLQYTLQQLNEKMKYVSPTRVETLVLNTIRHDTKIVQALKQAANYKCQFPNCGHQIIKKGGGYYIEVAHISPVKKNGKSILGNLIVLCPNHHKEFDFGEIKITKQSANELIGVINGLPFNIQLTVANN